LHPLLISIGTIGNLGFKATPLLLARRPFEIHVFVAQSVPVIFS